MQKAYKQTVRHYYKYVYNSFNRPNLTANGTIGENNFAVQASSEYGNYKAYLAFDGVYSASSPSENYNNYWCTGAGLYNGYIIFYNPNPLNISSLKIQQPMGSHYYVSGILYGSNNNVDWTQLATFTPSTTAYSFYTLDLEYVDYYKYYKIYIDGVNHSPALAEVEITATEKVAVESTSSDYDFYEDENEYSVFSESNNFYAFNNI